MPSLVWSSWKSTVLGLLSCQQWCASCLCAGSHVSTTLTLLPLLLACRSSMGAVPRAQLEAWLQAQCRPLLAAVDAATMLDLLLQHTYGETD